MLLQRPDRRNLHEARLGATAEPEIRVAETEHLDPSNPVVSNI
jgi:hypothetical protein